MGDSDQQGLANTGLGSSNNTSGLGSSTANPSTTHGTSHLGSATGTSGHSQGQRTSHLGRDAAALGTAGVVGEGIHHHRENERGLGSNTTNTNSGHGSANILPSTTSHATHLGSSGAPTSSTVQSGYGSNTGSDALSHSNHGTANVFPTTTSHSTQLGSSSSGHPSNTSTLPDRTLGSNQPTSSIGHGKTHAGNTSGHHLGRDAAAVGTAGAVAEGIHHHKDNERGLGSSGVTSGPHSTNTAILLDPSTSGGAKHLEDAHTHDPHHGGGAEAADHHHSGVGHSTTGTTSSRTDPSSTSTGKDHHYGRDTAIGAGGVGAAALAGR